MSRGIVNCILKFVILLNIVVHYTDASLTEIITTDKGPVRGQILKTVQEGVKYSAFRGIPFAEPPLGYRRFKVKVFTTTES